MNPANQVEKRVKDTLLKLESLPEKGVNGARVVVVPASLAYKMKVWLREAAESLKQQHA